MLNLAKLPFGGEAEVSKIGFKKRNSDDGSLIFDVDLTFTISSPAHIQAADLMLNGASQIIQVAEEKNTKLVVDDKTKRDDVRLMLSAGNIVPFDEEVNESDLMVNSKAEIRFSKLTVNGALAKWTTRFRVPGTGHTRADLIDNLLEVVNVRIEALQQNLFEVVETSEHKFEVGQTIVTFQTNGDFNCGLVQGKDDESILVSDADGSTVNVDIEDVQTSLQVSALDGMTVAREVEEYATRCERKGIHPKYADIMRSFQQQVAMDAQVTDDDGNWVLTKDVMDGAVALGTPVNVEDNRDVELQTGTPPSADNWAG